MERRDAIGLSVATAGHALLLAALALGLLNAPRIKVPPPAAIDVSFADAAALESATRHQGPATASVAPEIGETEAPAPTPLPDPVPEPEPRPVPVERPVVPTPASRPTPKPAPAPAPKPTPKPQAAPKAQPSPAKQSPAKSSADARTQTAKGSRLGPNFLQGITSDSAPAPVAAPTSPAKLSDVEARALNVEISRQLKPHWRAPAGVDADQLVTTLRWTLNRDGSIASGPDVVSQSGITASNQPQASLHREAAIRAVKSAAPFNLPPEYYAYWKSIIAFRFDKRL